MAWTITWVEFLVYAKQLKAVSDKIGDAWEWRGDEASPGAAYIAKKVLRRVPDGMSKVEEDMNFEEKSLAYEEKDAVNSQAPSSGTLVCTWEYHVLYSTSYGTPILYFNAYSPGGNLLSLEVLWRGLKGHACEALQHQRWEALSQQEHPVLRRPFFMLHPCKTAELLAPHKNHSANPLITWLSSIGPVVGLDLESQYGHLVSF